tara:strand:- start:8545 stop:9060 length:516 start_codon:yes stop_codon:yes gene_type:complete
MTGSRRRGWLALVLALVATAALLPLPWLVVLEGQRPRLALPGTTGTTFVLRWTHSVEREDWEERFRIEPDGGLMLVATRFKTFGAGVPDQAGTETHLQNGWVVMSGIRRPVDPLHVQAAAAEHYRLRYRGWTLALTGPDTPPILTFTTRDAPLLTMLPALLRAVGRHWRTP